MLTYFGECDKSERRIFYIQALRCWGAIVIICANIMFMFVLYFQLLLINMFVFLLCLDTIVCHSIGYTFYDQSLCYVLLLYDMVRPSSVLTSLGFPDVNSGSVWLLSITLYGNLPRNFRLNDVTCTSMELKVFRFSIFVWFRVMIIEYKTGSWYS